MTYFGFSFWHMKEKRNLGVTIVEGRRIEHAVEKISSVNIFPP